MVSLSIWPRVMGDCASMVPIGSWVRLVHGSWVFFFFGHGSWLIWSWVVADLVHGFFLVVGYGSCVFFVWLWLVVAD